jgi:hypothetical protein
MALSLLRDIHVKTTLAPKERELLETLQTAVGAKSLSSLVEQVYRPTDADYSKWLDVIRGYAKDGGMNINKKTDFLDIAGAVLENDPLNPPYSMHSAIMNKLWLNFKASRSDAKIEKAAAAQEEEERLSQAANMMIDAEEEEGPEYDSYVDSEVRDMRASADDEASGTDAWWHDETSMSDPDEYADDSITSGGPDMGDDPSVDDDRFDADGNVSSNGEFDAGGAPIGGDVRGDRMDYERRSRRDDAMTRSFENEEAGGDAVEAAGVAAAPKKMNMLQTMLSMPKKSINSKLKDFESEGTAAWTQHSMPKNPHPEDSMAYKAWERGMKKAMKSALGLDEKPAPAPKKKPTKKK